MNLRVVAALSGRLLMLVAVLMLLPAGLAAVDGSRDALRAFLGSFGLTFSTSALLLWLGRRAPSELHRKDAFGVVGFTWAALGGFGALPFLLEGSIQSTASAVFEAVSGFTTTGATVIGDIDSLSRATNLWRCLSHWVGGMGIVVLFVAVFPQLGVGAKHLFKTEVPGPVSEGLRPRIKHTALWLWWIYAALTALTTVLLWWAGLSWFDATCHALSTLGTGGFSTRGASVGAFENPAVDWILTLFMLVAGLNFGLFFSALRGRLRLLVFNYELLFFLGVNAALIAVVAWTTRDRHGDFLTLLRYSSFQVAAVTSSTGFMTEDFDTYPDIARFALFLAMFMGGCAGSTAGGLKASRVYALFKLSMRELRQAIQPHGVVAVRLGQTAIGSDVANGILVYFGAYFLLFSAASLIMVATGLEPLSAMSAVVACLSSIGPGLDQVGPTQNFEFIPAFGKSVLILCMIAGRLEIFALFALLSPETWRR